MCHGIDEAVTHEIDPIQFAVTVGINHRADTTDEVAQHRVVAVSINGGDDIAVDAVDEGDAFAAEDTKLQFALVLTLFFNMCQQFFEQVYVQSTAQAAVGADDDIADFLHRLVALAKKRMRYFTVCLEQVGNDAQDVFHIGSPFLHGILRAPHFGSRHHLHGFGDFLRAFDAFYLRAYVFGIRHGGFLTKRLCL